MGSAVRYLGSVARLAWRAARPAADRRGDRQAEGLTVERWGLQVDPTELKRYVQATLAEKLALSEGDRGALPPLFAASWETQLLLELMSHPSAPPVGRAVVHLETEHLQVRPADAGLRYRCRLVLERVEIDPRGRVLRVVTRTWNSAGQQCSESRSAFLLRDRESGNRNRQQQPGGDAPDGTEWQEVARWRLRSDHGRKYARASGDYNPAHLWRLTAAIVGFRRPILHGYCTAALTAHELLAVYCGGDPAALRRLRITFRRPVLLPSEPRLLAEADGARIRFRVVDDRGRDHASGELAAAR